MITTAHPSEAEKNARRVIAELKKCGRLSNDEIKKLCFVGSQPAVFEIKAHASYIDPMIIRTRRGLSYIPEGEL